MFDKIVILRRINNTDGTAVSVTIGLFNKDGILQLEIPQIASNLFPPDIKQGKEIVFQYPAKVMEIKK